MARVTLREKGFTLIESAVAIGLAGLVVVGLGSVMVNVYSIQSQVQTENCFKQMSSQYLAILGADAAWNKTIVDPVNRAGAFACFPGLVGCPTGYPASSFRILNAKGAFVTGNLGPPVVIDATNGFTAQCQPCATYAAGTNGCEFQFQLSYKVISGTTPVSSSSAAVIYYANTSNVDGQVIVSGTIATNNNKNLSKFNLASYGFQIARYAK